MYSAAFQKAFNLLMIQEGGFADHSLDRGGPTNKGITLKTLEAHRKSKVSYDDIKNLSDNEAQQIYYENYWEPLKLDQIISEKLAIIIFDQAVNQGPRTVAKRIQYCVNAAPDGIIGPLTLSLINSGNTINIGFKFISQSQKYYLKIVKNDLSQFVFLSGWINRTQNLFAILLWDLF